MKIRRDDTVNPGAPSCAGGRVPARQYFCQYSHSVKKILEKLKIFRQYASNAF
jgi:hypothetical protein